MPSMNVVPAVGATSWPLVTTEEAMAVTASWGIIVSAIVMKSLIFIFKLSMNCWGTRTLQEHGHNEEDEVDEIALFGVRSVIDSDLGRAP